MAEGGAETLSAIHELVAGRAGSSLSPQQRARLDSALNLHRRGRSDAVLLAHLSSPSGEQELHQLMAALSVHHTDMFRDGTQLESFFQSVLLPMVVELKRPLRVWSAGCATGEEVATLLVLLAEAGADPNSVVLGTDISATALERARTLTFSAEAMRRVSAERKQRYFVARGTDYALRSPLVDRAQFARHNLMDTPYPKVPGGGDGFDIIFCRNVLIYFTEAAFDRTVGLLGERLAPGGMLVLSAAEPILRAQPSLETRRFDQAFFYARTGSPRPGGAPSSPTRTVSGFTPVALGAFLTSPKVASTTTPTPTPTPAAVAAKPKVPAPLSEQEESELSPSAPELGRENGLDESRVRFQRVLDWCGAGKDEAEAEAGLRRCLYLDPHFAQARYLLGILLEGRGSKTEATAEYRRALAALEEGRVKPAAFFLNDERLKLACAQALKRLGPSR